MNNLLTWLICKSISAFALLLLVFLLPQKINSSESNWQFLLFLLFSTLFNHPELISEMGLSPSPQAILRIQ